MIEWKSLLEQKTNRDFFPSVKSLKSAGQPSLPIEKTEYELSQSGDREKKR